MAAVRERAHELIEANPLWDRREWMVQVTGMSELTIVGRVLASASDAASAWDLKCDLREELIRWLQDEHPNAFLRWSSEHRTIGPEPLTSATTSAPHLGRGLR